MNQQNTHIEFDDRHSVSLEIFFYSCSLCWQLFRILNINLETQSSQWWRWFSLESPLCSVTIENNLNIQYENKLKRFCFFCGILPTDFCANVLASMPTPSQWLPIEQCARFSRDEKILCRMPAVKMNSSFHTSQINDEQHQLEHTNVPCWLSNNEYRIPPLATVRICGVDGAVMWLCPEARINSDASLYHY